MSDPAAPAASRRAAVELGLLVAASLGCLLFWLTLPGRMPQPQDWESLRSQLTPRFVEGDAVAVAPGWADRVRLALPGLRIVGEPDVRGADLRDVRRLWLVGLPSVPRSDVAAVTQWLSSKLTVGGPAEQFGQLTLQRFDNPTFQLPLFLASNELGRAQAAVQQGANGQPCTAEGMRHRCPGGRTLQAEWREIGFRSQRCISADPLGGATKTVVLFRDVLLGRELDVWGAVTGEMGWRHDADLTPVRLEVAVDGQLAGVVEVRPGTVPAQHLKVDATRYGPGEHALAFAISSANPRDREFCFDARAD